MRTLTTHCVQFQAKTKNKGSVPFGKCKNGFSILKRISRTRPFRQIQIRIFDLVNPIRKRIYWI